MALITSLIDNGEKLAFELNIPNSRLQCKNHTQFESKNDHTLEGWTYLHSLYMGVPSLLEQSHREVSKLKTFRSVLMCSESTSINL